MIDLIIAALCAVVVWLLFTVRENRRELSKRLSAAEASLHQLKTTQDAMAQEWATVFANQQTQWDKHIDRVANAVTVELSLASHNRRNRR